MTHASRSSSLLAAALVALMMAACGDVPTAPSQAAQSLVVQGAAAEARPLRLQFEKCLVHVSGIWEGQVTGDVEGDLRTELRALRVSGTVWHVRFDWIITAGQQSFVADLSGTLNLNTGRVVMNGTVAEGYLAGARVHEEGQLVDPEASCFSGTIRIMPATAG